MHLSNHTFDRTCELEKRGIAVKSRSFLCHFRLFLLIVCRNGDPPWRESNFTTDKERVIPERWVCKRGNLGSWVWENGPSLQERIVFCLWMVQARVWVNLMRYSYTILHATNSNGTFVAKKLMRFLGNILQIFQTHRSYDNKNATTNWNLWKL